MTAVEATGLVASSPLVGMKLELGVMSVVRTRREPLPLATDGIDISRTRHGIDECPMADLLGSRSLSNPSLCSPV